MSVFVSYARETRPAAEALHRDLVRGGLAVWRDPHIRTDSPDWAADVAAAVAGCSHFLLLASPEAAGSPEVGKELAAALAAGKPVHTLLVGGDHRDLPAAWQRRQVTDFRADYGPNLRALLRALGAPAPDVRALPDLLAGPPTTVAAAAAELGGAVRLDAGGREYCGLPADPSGYAGTWLFGPAGAGLGLPDEVAVLLQFAGEPGRRAERAVLEFWSAGRPAGAEPWLVWVDGPRSEAGGYALAGGHAWRDAVDVSVRAVQRFGTRRRVGLFFHCPVALGFAVGGRLREMVSCRLYNWDRDKGVYEPVYPPAPA
jgi:hypothetical protein